MNELLAVTYFGGRVRMFFLLEIELKYVPSKLRRNGFLRLQQVEQIQQSQPTTLKCTIWKLNFCACSSSVLLIAGIHSIFN